MMRGLQERLAALLLAVLLLSAAGALEPDASAALKPGDLVFINVHRQPELSTTTQVDGNGNVELPYIGNVSVKDLSLEDAASRVSLGLQSILKNPRVTVSRSSDVTTMKGAFMRTESMQTQVIPRFEALHDPFRTITPQGNFTVGSRYYIPRSDWVSFNIGVRTWIFPDKLEPAQRGPSTGVDGLGDLSNLDDPGEAKANADTALSFNTVFFLGVSFYLPRSFEYTTRR